MSKLAINGGEPIRKNSFPRQETIGEEEKKAVMEVLDSKMLSGYRGNWIKEFWGGPQVKELEKEWSAYFGIRNSIAVNSCTSALQIACGAIDLKPDDEVIVTPWSMSCSASAPLVWGATPVFADIDKDSYCLSPKSIEEKITSKTKAIIVVDLFGQCYDFWKINDLAKKYNLYIIEDAAQAIGSKSIEPDDNSNLGFSGTFGHIGCFSFTQGKHLTSGEGGMIVTNDNQLAFKCQLIRNHAEAVISAMKNMPNTSRLYNLSPRMFGYNMRMTEIQAAIIRCQLKKLDRFVQRRVKNVFDIKSELSNIPAIVPSEVFPGNTHSYYVQSFKWDQNKADGIHRDQFINAVKAELAGEEGRPDRPLLGNGYITPLYRMPLFHKNYNWIGLDSPIHNFSVVEDLWKNKLFISMYHNLSLSDQDVQDIVEAFKKVWKNRKGLIGRSPINEN